MSPEMKADFARQWPELSRRLDRLLARKGVAAALRDDLVQETGLRLLKMWNAVDRSRSASPLATAIAINLLRDEMRRRSAHPTTAEIPDIPDNYDLENAGIARVELERVREALAQLSPVQRSALLVEVGNGAAFTAGRNAEKMARLRARRRLNALVRNGSAWLTLKWRRWAEVAQSMLGTRDDLARALSCLACLSLGLAGPLADAPLGTADAGPRPTTVRYAALDDAVTGAAPVVISSAEPRRGRVPVVDEADTNARRVRDHRGRPGASSPKSGGSSPTTMAGSESVEIPPLPGGPENGNPLENLGGSVNPPEAPTQPRDLVETATETTEQVVPAVKAAVAVAPTK